MNKRGIETRKWIKEKAALLFAEKGFKDVTMKDVCEVSGLSRGGLYCHYESTQQIFQEILRDLMSSQEDEINAKIEQDQSAVSILDEVLERYREEMTDSQSSLSAAIYEYYSRKENSAQDNPLAEQYQASFRAWKKLIQYGVGRKEFADVDVQAVFDLIVFSYQGIRMYSKLMPVGRETPAGMLREIRAILVRRESDGNCFSEF